MASMKKIFNSIRSRLRILSALLIPAPLPKPTTLKLFCRPLPKTPAGIRILNFSLRFVGKVSKEVHRQIEEANLLYCTEFVPFVPHLESIKYLMKATVLLMAIPDVENNFCILPGKIFEYLASNKQIICIGPLQSDADRIIDECGAGRVFNYVTYDLMLDHLDTLSHNWKVNPNLDLPYINYNRYSRKYLAEKLAELIRNK